MMRFAWTLLGLAATATPLASQATVRLTGGVTHSSPLVDDGALLTQLTPALAPTVGIALSYPTGAGGYRIVLEADYRRAALDAVDNDPSDPNDGMHDRIGTLTTIDALLLLEGRIRGRLDWQAGGGAVFYRPAEDEGVFQDGGTQRWVITAGLKWAQPLNERWNVIADGRIDYQEFTTDLLKTRGYGQSQSVQRFTLQVGVERKL